MALNADVDLALLGYDQLQELGRKHGINGCDGFARPDLVCALRNAGIGSSWTSASKCQVDVFASLTEQILHLTTEVSSFNSLKAEVICIKSE